MAASFEIYNGNQVVILVLYFKRDIKYILFCLLKKNNSFGESGWQNLKNQQLICVIFIVNIMEFNFHTSVFMVVIINEGWFYLKTCIC